jgi:hypothetical protein
MSNHFALITRGCRPESVPLRIQLAGDILGGRPPGIGLPGPLPTCPPTSLNRCGPDPGAEVLKTNLEATHADSD